MAEYRKKDWSDQISWDVLTGTFISYSRSASSRRATPSPSNLSFQTYPEIYFDHHDHHVFFQHLVAVYCCWLFSWLWIQSWIRTSPKRCRDYAAGATSQNGQKRDGCQDTACPTYLQTQPSLPTPSLNLQQPCTSLTIYDHIYLPYTCRLDQRIVRGATKKLVNMGKG